MVVSTDRSGFCSVRSFFSRLPSFSNPCLLVHLLLEFPPRTSPLFAPCSALAIAAYPLRIRPSRDCLPRNFVFLDRSAAVFVGCAFSCTSATQIAPSGRAFKHAWTAVESAPLDLSWLSQGHCWQI